MYLDKYPDLILRVENSCYDSEEGVEKFRAKTILQDGTILHISETWIDGKLLYYSYYWLDEENNQIIGWDNAPHHPELDNYPHHKHIKTKKRIIPSYEIKLEDVLSFIQEYFKK